MSRFIAVDWGTTNRRAFVVERGTVSEKMNDPLGVLAVPAGHFENAVAELRTRLGGGSMILAGMVGSNRGWLDAGYVSSPASIATIARNAVFPLQDVAVLPGVSHLGAGRADVMRGEEIQFLGAAAEGLVPPDALLCQPGTHCKWARVHHGSIVDFETAMTGEMFSLLKSHALIGGEMLDVVTDGPEFERGVEASASGDLLGALFSVRPASVLAVRDPGTASSFISGLLIGSDVRSHCGKAAAIHVLAEGLLGTLYMRAIGLLGVTAHHIDSQVAFVSGMVRIKEHLA